MKRGQKSGVADQIWGLLAFVIRPHGPAVGTDCFMITGPLPPKKLSEMLRQRELQSRANALNRCRDNRCAGWVVLEAHEAITLGGS
jgi:hypothetical protein